MYMWEDKNYFRWADKTSPFHGELVGYSHCDGTYYQARKESDVTVLEYITEGTGTVKVNGTDYKAKKGDVYLLPLYTNHIYYSSDSDPWKKYFINIRGKLPSELINQYNLQLQYIFHNTNTEELFLELYNCAKMDIDEELRQELFTSLVHRIFIRLKHCGNANFSSDDASLIKSMIDNSPNKIYSIEELAKQLNRSKDFVIKTFQRRYGITPHAYTTIRKIDTAKMLLKETNLRIEEIAFSLGYQSTEHFSTQFKKHCNMSPTHYRNKK